LFTVQFCAREWKCMQPENDRSGSNFAGNAEDWLRHANSNLALARVTPPPTVMLESLCFHAQQAAEKALKAVLVFRSVSFPRTHSIRMILDLLARHVAVPEEIQYSAGLTAYAVIARYPGVPEPVEREEYEEAVRMAEVVVSWAERIIRA
jgi:HEPN domain-containing protein